MRSDFSRALSRRLAVTGAVSAVALVALAGPAEPASLLSAKVTAAKAVKRDCLAPRLASTRGVVTRAVTAPSPGYLRVRLTASRGDWDVAVFDARTRRTIAGSTHYRARELAEGFATSAGQRLTVRACRRSGTARNARLTVGFDAIDLSQRVEKVSLVHVSTPTAGSERKLASLGLDLTEHSGPGFVAVVLYGADDARKLEDAGLSYSVEVSDLVAQSRADRKAEAVYAQRVRESRLPSGRTTYRRLMDYTNEMKQVAEANSDLVRRITLPYRTWEGRPVEGIEITTNPTARDGKPVFLQMGLHHAREWPSGEHAMEWAYELVNGYRAGNARVVPLVQSTRTIVVPVVNPDGFNISRETGQLLNGGAGRDGDETANIVSNPNEYRRKNCRLVDDSPAGNCAQPAAGLASPGVDPNRNYGGFWGGPGASASQVNETYRGPGPFSEPETQNVRWLVSSRHVTTLITNHTFSNLVLRPPGVASQGLTPDEPIYKALGDSMAAENGYSSQFGYQLYDTTGTTEDWSYWTTGGLGFTFEIGPSNFHPPYQQVVAEYEGTTAVAGPSGDGNREAYFLAQQNTADATKHSVIAGRAPAGAVLRLKKTFQTPTSQRNADGSYKTFTDTLDTTMVVPGSTRFEWHVNPSTRPLVAQERGRVATGSPSPQQTFAGGPETTTPCAEYDNPPPGCYNDHPFTAPTGEGIDNAKATIRIEWATVASDWDLKVYRDTNADGVPDGDPVATSGQGITDFEQATINDPAGSYVIRVINWAAAEPYNGTITYEGPEPYQPAQTESWTLTCESPENTVRTTLQVTIARGQRQSYDLRSACKKK